MGAKRPTWLTVDLERLRISVMGVVVGRVQWLGAWLHVHASDWLIDHGFDFGGESGVWKRKPTDAGRG